MHISLFSQLVRQSESGVGQDRTSEAADRGGTKVFLLCFTKSISVYARGGLSKKEDYSLVTHWRETANIA